MTVTSQSVKIDACRGPEWSCKAKKRTTGQLNTGKLRRLAALHWAMDRNVIAPAPDHRWLVSRVIDPRRSNGEEKLSELAGKSLLLPKDPAFYADTMGLEWRTRHLVA
jgi:hypothetical protein